MKISPVFFTSGLGMVGVALVSSLYIVDIGGTPLALLLGGVAWIVSVVLKFIWAIPTNKIAISFFKRRLSERLAGPVSWTYIGLLTGVFECGIALAFVKLIPLLGKAEWVNILAFGVGFGATEALLLGLFSLGRLTFYYIRPESIPEKEVKDYVLNRDNALLLPMGALERVFALLVHVFTKALIVLAVQQNNYLLFWFSFGFKSLVDASAAWLIMEKNFREISDTFKLWKYESIFFIFALVSLLGIYSFM